MAQWGFFFNQDRCVGCKTCMLACKNWNEERRGDAKINVMSETTTADGKREQHFSDMPRYMSSLDNNPQNLEWGGNHINLQGGGNHYEEYRKYYMKEEWRRVTTIEEGATAFNSLDGTFDITTDRRYLSVSCNHCSKPLCVEVCPVSNISKDADTGAVLVGSGCISCGKCRQACPWGAPQYYDKNYATYKPGDEKSPMMTKCNLCIDRIADGKKPACVAACWNRALDAGPMDWLRNKYRSAPFNYTLKTNLGSDFESDPNLGPNILFKDKLIKVPQ